MNEAINFELLIGKPLLDAEQIIGCGFKSDPIGNKFYINKEFFNKSLYGISYNFVTIQTNKTDNIESVTVHLSEIMNSQFYNSFIQKYGEPISVLVVENRKKVSETKLKDDEITQHLKKNTFDLREGNFEEKPLYIIWKKENYQIKAFLRHKQGITEITFEALTN